MLEISRCIIEKRVSACNSTKLQDHFKQSKFYNVHTQLLNYALSKEFQHSSIRNISCSMAELGDTIA